MKRAQEKVNDVSGYKATVKSLIERAVIFFRLILTSEFVWKVFKSIIWYNSNPFSCKTTYAQKNEFFAITASLNTNEM